MSEADLHREVCRDDQTPWCDECGLDWPCSVGALRAEVERLTAERDEARRWGIEQRDEREWPWAHTDDGLRRKRMTPAEAWPPPWATEGEGTP